MTRYLAVTLLFFAINACKTTMHSEQFSYETENGLIELYNIHKKNKPLIVIIPDLFNIKIALGHFDIIISNIVDNAFKFSKKEDEVIVKVFKNDSHVFISIEDSGSGITADKMKQVDAFTQFDVNKNKLTQNGLGLGLITSKKLIEFYGGSLKMSSKKDKGTIVQISLLLADK